VGQRGDCRYYSSFYAEHVTIFILFMNELVVPPFISFLGSFAGREQ
jgi:hypothetical protein